MGITPARESNPRVDRMLKRLFALAGLRNEFTVSVPVPNTVNEAAMAAPVPPELPPGVRVRSYGFRVCPPAEETVSPSSASSWRLAFPRMMAPALRNAATVGASTVGWESFRSRQPPVVFISTVSKLSLSNIGMQNRGPVAFPAARALSISSAIESASGLKLIKALMSPLYFSIRERKDDTTSRHDTVPPKSALWTLLIVASRLSKPFKLSEKHGTTRERKTKPREINERCIVSLSILKRRTDHGGSRIGRETNDYHHLYMHLAANLKVASI